MTGDLLFKNAVDASAVAFWRNGDNNAHATFPVVPRGYAASRVFVLSRARPAAAPARPGDSCRSSPSDHVVVRRARRGLTGGSASLVSAGRIRRRSRRSGRCPRSLGEDTQALLDRDLEDDSEILSYPDARNKRAALTGAVYRHVPAPHYLDYLELALEKYARDRAIVQVDYIDIIEDPRIAPIGYLNELFAARRIDYRFDENGRARWHGDAGAYCEIIRPALDALDDDRLAGARQEFESALGHLRSGTPKDQEDAIEEAGKAVESAMTVLLDSHRVTRSGNETAEPLWNLLRENEIIPPKTNDAVLSTSRLRNEYGGHGQGAEIREIPVGIPALAVRSAAATIAYLAELLP